MECLDLLDPGVGVDVVVAPPEHGLQFPRRRERGMSGKSRPVGAEPRNVRNLPEPAGGQLEGAALLSDPEPETATRTGGHVTLELLLAGLSVGRFAVVPLRLDDDQDVLLRPGRSGAVHRQIGALLGPSQSNGNLDAEVGLAEAVVLYETPAPSLANMLLRRVPPEPAGEVTADVTRRDRRVRRRISHGSVPGADVPYAGRPRPPKGLPTLVPGLGAPPPPFGLSPGRASPAAAARAVRRPAPR